MECVSCSRVPVNGITLMGKTSTRCFCLVYHNGESESYTEEMRWCRCYEGQRDEVWGCQDPLHTGLIIIQPIQRLLYIDSSEEVVILFEVELQKPRNLSASESEGCGNGEGVGVYATLCLLLIDKARSKDKTYIWVSVWWKTKIYLLWCSIRVFCLLWINKTRATEKTYVWVSVRWKTYN
jgi:hypothetical protein